MTEYTPIERNWKKEYIGARIEIIYAEKALGKALGYGHDMREVGGVEDDVCLGEHILETLADETVKKIKSLEEEVRVLKATPFVKRATHPDYSISYNDIYKNKEINKWKMYPINQTYKDFFPE